MHELVELEAELGCELMLEWEEAGEEVGYPDVKIVGLYRGMGNKENTMYYIDSKEKKVLETFVLFD